LGDEHPLQLPRAQLCVVEADRTAEDNVRRQRGLLAPGRPQVKMVNRLEQDTPRVAQQLPRARDHQQRNRDRDGGVEPIRIEERDTGTGDDDSDRTHRVTEQVPEDTAHMDVVVRVTEERGRARDVDDQADRSDDEDTSRADCVG
jgi:hypothetical protein